MAIGGDEGAVYVYQFNPPPLQPRYQQENGAGRVISIEVENNDANVIQGGFSWESRSESSASGSKFLQAMPLPNTPPEIINQNFDENFQIYNPLVDSPKYDF